MSNMAASFSGRPDTSLPASDRVTAPSTESAPTSKPDAAPFVPHVFDLVYIARRAELSVARPVMQLYLGAQAIDQSTFLGQGASFEVSCKKVPKSDGFEYKVESMGLTMSSRQGKHNEQVLVYKTANIAFSELGEPLAKDRRAMNSILMEIYALTHPPLYKHSNIVTLLALGWGTNPYNSSYRLPVIVTEFADQGNLATLQAREILTSETKRNLSLDIGRGLQVLHACGIIHGDVKSENVLIFSDPEKKYVAKLGDFGFSLVGEASADQVYIGGTTPWRAPETTQPVPRHLLTGTDVYSYGLTVWRIAMDGMNPFHFLHDHLPSRTGINLAEVTERLKNEDVLKDKTQLDQWYPQWAISSMDKLSAGSLPDVKQVVPSLQRDLDNLVQGATISPQTLDLLKYIYWVTLRHGTSSNSLVQKVKQGLLKAAALDSFYGKVGELLKKCVVKCSSDRDLARAMSELLGSNDFQRDVDSSTGSAFTSDMLLRQSFDHHLMSWQAVRDLQPSVQTFLFERFRARADLNASQNKVHVAECFVLASFYMNGYGAQSDPTEARHFILHAAANGHPVSQAYIWRIFKATGTELPINERYLATLENRVFSGSRAALHDLAIIAPERLDRVKKILKLGYAGVGASFWVNDLIHGFSFAQWGNTLRDPSVLINNLDGLSDIAGYRVNKRGDRILHIAASCGHSQAVEALLDKFPALVVNQLNDADETPLLSACRSGHREVIEVLMKRGADPTIVTSSQESPLHWLISFEEDEMEGVGQILLSKGADVWSTTSTPTKYSEFPSGIDVDNLPPGTPLTWAVQQDRPDIVRFLIRAAGTARICVGNSDNMPIEWANKPMQWAAHYHYRECLEVMISAMKEEKIGFTYMDFLRAATHSADKFSMLLRNGTSYMDRFTDTMNYLLEETHGAAFGTGIGEFGYTLLYYAISEAHDLVVEYLLSSETAELLQAGWERLRKAAKEESDIPIRQYGAYSSEHVNSPCGNEQRTPLLECVRWNRCELFDLLVSKGADIQARSRNPFDSTKTNWSALHTFAHASHDSDISLAEKIIEAGVSADAQLEGSVDLETPLLVAVKNNAFKLAAVLLRHGASIDAKCVSSGLITLEFPTTVLGQVIASAARGAVTRLRFILTQCSALVSGSADNGNETFLIVEPERCLTALHRGAWAHRGVFDRIPDGHSSPEAIQRGRYDFAQNRDIVYELLQHFGASKNYVNAKTNDKLLRRTALHLAVNAINQAAVELLLDQETVDLSIEDANGYTALELAVQSAQHPGIKCDGPCGLCPLPGRRWRCTICPDHDLCDACYRMSSSSSTEHELNEVPLSEACAKMASKSKWSAAVPPEMEDLVKIINLLQSSQMRQTTREAMENLNV